jgi:hypothetical protein
MPFVPVRASRSTNRVVMTYVKIAAPLHKIFLAAVDISLLDLLVVAATLSA